MIATIIDCPVTPEIERVLLACSGACSECDCRAGEIGCAIRFDGLVRRLESTGEIDQPEGRALRPLVGLVYEAYEPMASREFASLAQSIAREFSLAAISAIHSRGLVKVGEVSFVLIVEASHRREGIAAVQAFIDRLKCDVPIWKNPVWA